MSSDSGLCKYRNALGVPGTGAHSIRIGNIAIVDVVLTLVGAYIIAYFARTSFVDVVLTLVGANIFAYFARTSFAWTAAGLFLAGIILHRLFCVRTTIDKLLFPLFPMFPNTK